MLNATLIQRIEVTPELIIIRVKPDGGVPEFLSGQYVALGLYGQAPRPEGFPPAREEIEGDKLIKRAYSIGSSPQQNDFLEFYIAIVKDGSFTSRLCMLKQGDRLFAAPKIIGTFTLHDVPLNHNLVLVSTGTGLAPFISMLRTSSTWSPTRNIVVVHGVRFPEDLAYRRELEGYARDHKNFTYIPVVSRAGPDWTGRRGHAQKLFTEGVLELSPTTDHVFLCGNPAMIEETQALLESKGYTAHSKKHPGTLHLEKYW